MHGHYKSILLPADDAMARDDVDSDDDEEDKYEGLEN
jgi:hypothetical protein